MRSMSAYTLFLIVLCVQTLSVLCGNTDEATNDVDIEQWLDDLDWKGQMGQMAQLDIKLLLTTTQPIQLDQELLNEFIGERGVGSVLNNHYLWKAADYRREVIRIQETAHKYNRPPVVWGLDSVHGANYILDAVVTPQPINLAASFNRTLALEAGKLASKDTRRAGISWLFSPLLGLSWNPFWSRVYETFGEDPLVVGEMAESMIRGIQMLNDKDKGRLLPSRAAACAKHYVGYSDPHNGHDRAPSMIPMRHLYQYFLLPWRKALLKSKGDGRPMTVMESYTEIDGVPNVANRRTLDRMLRKELHFTDGMVVTDYNEVTNLERWHHIASDMREALLLAMEEGTIDMSMIGNLDDARAFFKTLEEFLNGGSGSKNRIMRERVRNSARRILKLKRDLNMFEESFHLKPLAEDTDFPTREDIATVLDMTRQSMVMTKNKNNALPLIDPQEEAESASSAPLNILLTGPTSNSLSFQSGGWTGEWQGVNSNTEREWFTYGGYKTVLDALKDETDKFEVKHECGVDILGKECNYEWEDKVSKDNEKHNKNLFDKVRGWIHGNSNNGASDLPSNTSPDAIVVCLGEENYAEKPGDITDLNLPQGQYDLVKALKDAIGAQPGQTNKTKIILVYFGGRPRLLGDVVPLVDAVIIGFLPGPFAGNAIADFLTGRVSPSARLPLTYPKHQDLGGVPYLNEVSDKCTSDTGGTLPHWDNRPCTVEWHFGHGLTYYKFTYENLRLSTTVLQQHWHDEDEDSLHYEDEYLTVTVAVTNTGHMAGAETVLFFAFDEFRSTTPESKRLLGYEKVWLEPMKPTDVSITISLQDHLRFVGPHDDSHYILQNGLKFKVGIGSAELDCNISPNACSEVVLIRTENNYVGACESACDLWKESGDECAKKTFLPKAPTLGTAIAQCRSSCANIHYATRDDVTPNNDGWGWNYVKCLESIVWNEMFDQKTDCWKMTSLCRDVTRTNGIDEFGNGSNSYDRSTQNFTANDDPPKLTIIVAMIAGFFASFMIIREVRGCRCTTSTPNHSQGRTEDKYGDVEFSAIQSIDERNKEVC